MFQIGTAAIPDAAMSYVRALVVAAAIFVLRWFVGLFSGLDPFFLWVGSSVIVMAVVWTTVGIRKWFERPVASASDPASPLPTAAATTYDYRKFQSNQMETISRHTYFNESVEVDGKIFDRCSFTNVTFTYHGTATFSFNGASFAGNIIAQTDNAAAKAYLSLVHAIRKVPGVNALVVAEKDTAGNISVVSREEIPAQGPPEQAIAQPPSPTSETGAPQP
jgi:hypothetical protein